MAVATARWLVLLLAISAACASGVTTREKWRASGGAAGGQVVEKEGRRVVAASEAGLVTAADVVDAVGTAYRLQFITMNPGTLFLPVQLHADMVFYVHSGKGKVTYIEEGSSESSSLEVERGDVYNFEQGTIIYIQSYPNTTRERLRIYAIFTGDIINADDPSNPTSEAYSNVSDQLKGFEIEVLRMGFGVPRGVVEAIKSAKSPPSIIPYNPEKHEDESNWKEDIMDALWGVRDPHYLNKKKKKDKSKHKDKDKKSKSKTFNFYSGKPDVENCYGWSRTMTTKDLQTLKGSNIGMFMVNLTTGAMMGPHWNPRATEIAIVTEGEGIVQVVCPSIPSSSGESKGRHGEEGGHGHHHHGEAASGTGCRNTVFRVKEGDAFVVPQFYPMAQISFNNDSFVFVGFSTDMGHNHPQFLAGKSSVLQLIGKEILALSLGQRNATAVEKLLSAQRGSTILACTSCAEELEKKAEEEEERGREEREREEEERRRKEQEEKEEKERREQEEEERRKKKEEKERREQEEEERRKEKEEKERREQEEEERRKKEKEEKERREQEEEERKQREKEEERARKEQEEEERRQREKEEERQREEEERARREQEEERRRREEEEEQEGGGGDEPREEEEEGDWPQYRLSKNLRKRYRASKLFRSA